MAGNINHGAGPASVLHPSAADGTLYLRSDGPAEYRQDGQWLALSTGPAGGPSLSDDFLSASGATLPAPLGTQVTGTTPTADYVDDAAGGAYALKLDTTNEIESAMLYQLDQLTWAATSGPVLEVRVKLEPDVGGGSGELGTGDHVVIGLASARNADPDLIVEHAWFRLQGDGANKDILIETDDGTTDTDDQDTGIDWVANTYLSLRIDLTDLSNVGFYVDGVRAGAVLMDLSQASGNLQLYVEVAKAAAVDNDHRLTVDYFDIRAGR